MDLVLPGAVPVARVDDEGYTLAARNGRADWASALATGWIR
jgi:hypothetical protein